MQQPVARLVQVFNVQCVMCGRAAGQLMNGVFVQSTKAPAPIPGKTGSRCGECGGNLYLEPDEAITPFMAAQITRERRAAAALTQRAA
jgi:hypothetical protein